MRVRGGAPSPDHDVSARGARRSDPYTRTAHPLQCPPHLWTSRKVSTDLHRQPEKEQWLHLAPSELARPRGRMCDLSHSQPAMKKSASHSTGLRPLRVALPGQMVAHLARRPTVEPATGCLSMKKGAGLTARPFLVLSQ